MYKDRMHLFILFIALNYSYVILMFIIMFKDGGGFNTHVFIFFPALAMNDFISF